MIVYEFKVRGKQRIKNLVRNHCLAKSINDAGCYQFRKWLEYFGIKMGRIIFDLVGVVHTTLVTISSKIGYYQN